MIVLVGKYRREGTRLVVSVDQELSRTQVDLIDAVLQRHGMTEDRVVAVEIDEGQTVVEYLRWNDQGRPFVDVENDCLATARSVVPNGRAA